MVLDDDIGHVIGHAGEERVDVGVVVRVLDHLVLELTGDHPEVARPNVLGATEQLVRRHLVEPAREALNGTVLGLAVAPVDEVVPLLHLVHDEGNLRGVRLEVVVHAQNEVALGVAHGAHETVVLPEVAHERYPVDAGVLLAELPDDLEGPVRRAVVHQDELAVVSREASKRLERELDDLPDGVLRVVAGNDHRNELVRVLLTRHIHSMFPAAGQGGAGRLLKAN